MSSADPKKPFVSQTDKGLNRGPEQVAQNVSAASWKLTAEELVKIGRITV
jgi:hypothetical protein